MQQSVSKSPYSLRREGQLVNSLQPTANKQIDRSMCAAREICVKDRGRFPVCVCAGIWLSSSLCLSLTLPPLDTLSVKQTCSDNEGWLLFRLGRRQSSPHFASAATGERLQLTAITLNTDNAATYQSIHHSCNTENLYFRCSVKELRRNSFLFSEHFLFFVNHKGLHKGQGLRNQDHTAFKVKNK